MPTGNNRAMYRLVETLFSFIYPTRFLQQKLSRGKDLMPLATFADGRWTGVNRAYLTLRETISFLGVPLVARDRRWRK